eukprot:tig00021038_g17525.t1
MGGGRSRHRPPPAAVVHRPAPPRPAPPPPPPPPKPAPLPPPPSAPKLHITETAETPPRHLPGEEMFGAGGPKFSQRELERLVKEILGGTADMSKFEQSTNPKILSIPDIVRRYTKALCMGKERIHPDKAAKNATPKKCHLYGNDLHLSPDFTIFTDEFKYLKVTPPIQKPGQVIIADADNDSPIAQTETIERTVKVIDIDSFTADKTLKTGASVSAAIEVKIPIPIPFTPITIDINTKVENKTKAIVNLTDTKDQSTESITELKLAKEVTLPPYSHADVIWTINEGKLDLPWTLKVHISGSFNLMTFEPPKERLSKSYCGEALRAAFEQKVMYDNGMDVKLPDYLVKCGLKATVVPICEALVWAGRIKPENAAKDFSSCHFTMDGSYKGIHATNYKAQVKVKPYDRGLKAWQLALHRGHKLGKFKLDRDAIKSIMKYAKESIGINFQEGRLDHDAQSCPADSAEGEEPGLGLEEEGGGVSAYRADPAAALLPSDEADAAAASALEEGGDAGGGDPGEGGGAELAGWTAHHAWIGPALLPVA